MGFSQANVQSLTEDSAGGVARLGEARGLSGHAETGAWVMLALMGVLALGLGMAGFHGHYRETVKPAPSLGDWRYVSELLYRSLRLFVLELDLPRESPGRPMDARLDAARWLAAATTAGGVWGVLWRAWGAYRAFRREQREDARLRGMSGHVVLCGLGQRSMHLLRQLRRRGDSVVAIERNPANGQIAYARAEGAIVLVGDATDGRVLRRARVERAEKLVALCGTDSGNLEVLLAAQQGAAGGAVPYAHLVHPALSSIAGLATPGSEGAAGVRLFNSFSAAARQLFKHHPLDGTGIGAEDPRSVHLVIVGFGRMGQHVALQAARLGHFANGRKLELTIIDLQAEARYSAFSACYPALERICELRLIEGNVYDLEVRQDLERWAADEGRLLRVIVCLPQDEQAMACALSLPAAVRQRRVPVFVRVSRCDGLARWMEQATRTSDRYPCLHAFGDVQDTLDLEVVFQEALDRTARQIHEAYRRQRDDARQGDPALLPWDRLSEDLRDSNRQQTDHIDVKLRAIGYRRENGDDAATEVRVDQFSDEETELLAGMEHARWCAERWLAGWVMGPEADKENRITPYLVAYEELSEAIKEYDREAVRRIPGLLRSVGQRVIRTDATAPSALV